MLRFAGVGKTFGTGAAAVTVLDGLDLVVTAGEFLAVTGPSGSGKSTFLHLAALLDRPSRGRLDLLGESMIDADETRLCRARAEQVGMVFQRYALLGHRSALDNVLFRFRYTRRPPRAAREEAMAALDRVGLGEAARRPARLLSGGEMQRVAIARAIVARPALLVADEPTGNLDAEATAAIMRLFSDLHADGLTVVMVTHNLQLLRHASRHVVLRGGRIVPGERH